MKFSLEKLLKVGLKVGGAVTGVPIDTIFSNSEESLRGKGGYKLTNKLTIAEIRDMFKDALPVFAIRQMDRVSAEWTLLSTQEHEEKGKKAQSRKKTKKVTTKKEKTKKVKTKKEKTKKPKRRRRKRKSRSKTKSSGEKS